MDWTEFSRSLGGELPPAQLDAPLIALWHIARGETARAEEILRTYEGEPSADWVRAHLARTTGDDSAAARLYASAERPMPTGSAEDERRGIAEELLGRLVIR